MPAPDVQYVLDSSLECGHIGGDTHFFFMELCPNTNQIMDEYTHPAMTPERSYWSQLTDMGLAFEQSYLKWRAGSPAESMLASFQGLRHVPYIFREMSRTAASHIVENDFGGLTPNALKHLEERFDFSRSLQIMRRTMRRASADFSGATMADMRVIRDRVEGRYDENRREYQATLARIRAGIGDGSIEVHPYRSNDIWVENVRSDREVKDMRARLRERVKDERRVIKRSVKFLTKLVGSDTTRMFLSGDRIRFEGRHAIYELQKQSNLMESHGGFRALSVFDKDHPDLLLCQLCINTPEVPLLDHVASLILHIQAGEEDQILNIGNANNINDAAYDRPWLTPFLPKRRSELNLDLDRMILSPWMRNPALRARREKQEAVMRKVTAKHIFEEVIADFLPVANAACLRFGTDPAYPPDQYTPLELETFAA